MYNEDDVEFTNLPEENMVVCSWINDMGAGHKEYDVRPFIVTIIGQNSFLQQ
jgi:hypothetical protein